MAKGRVVRMAFAGVVCLMLAAVSALQATEEAMKFDGSDDYASDTLASSLTGDLTLEAWIKTDAAAESQERIVALPGANGALQICINGGRFVLDNSGGPASGISGPEHHNNGLWHQVAVTRSGSTYAFFVDGIYWGDCGGTAPTYTDIYIGVSPGQPYFDGLVDDVRVYSRALNHAEVIQNYEETTGVVTNGLVSWWALNGDATDRIGNNDCTTVGSPQYVAGRALTRRALAFDGENDYLSASLGSSLTGDLTVEAWISSAATQSLQERIVGVWGNSGALQLCTNGGYFVLDNSGGPTSGITDATAKNDGKWHHAAVTRATVSGTTTYKLYVDGGYVGSSTGTAPTYTDVYMGLSPGQPMFEGMIDEVRVYNGHALDAAEIEANYLEQVAPVASGLQNQWKLDNDLKDAEDTGGDCSVTGAPEWMPGRDKRHWALDFDGTNDYMSASLAASLTGDLTVETWLYSTATPSLQERIIGVSGASGSLQICINSNGNYIVDNEGGPTSGITSAAACNDGKWHHVAVTRSGTTYKLYVDGAYVGSSGGTAPAYASIYMGIAPSKPRYKGRIDEVHVYSRALTGMELFNNYAETQPLVARDVAGLWPLESDYVDQITYTSCYVAGSPDWVTGRGRGNGDDPRTAQVLNNMVLELLKVDETISGSTKTYSFVNPRDGWIFFSGTTRANLGANDWSRVTLDPAGADDDVLIHAIGKEYIQEGMRHLAAGKYTVEVAFAGNASLDEVVVRAIPEIIFAEFLDGTQISGCGPYNLSFMQGSGILRNMTTIESDANGSAALDAYCATWQSAGKRCLSERGIGYQDTAQEYADDWMYPITTSQPASNGILIDEFLKSGWTDGERNLALDAVDLLLADGDFNGKLFYPYVCSDFSDAGRAADTIALAEKTIAGGGRVAWERYLMEPRDLDANSLCALDTELRKSLMVNWQQEIPDVAAHMVMVLGNLEIPPGSLNINPASDFKVWLDQQYHLLATAPEFFGLYGVMQYTSGYSDPETLRWMARLWRHYCIEGHTEMLSSQYGYELALEHIDNPDFNDGETGWTASEAQTGSITTADVHNKEYDDIRFGFNTWQGTDEVLLMTRQSSGANSISQNITGLTAGRLYSVKMITGDYDDLVGGISEEQSHNVAVSLTNATVENSIAGSHYKGVNGAAFTANNPFWMNYWHCIFRPSGTSSTLTISETGSSPVGQTLMVKFIEAQPCYCSVTLNVQSEPFAHVSIGVNIADLNGLGSAYTPFTREYDAYNTVMLTAPATADGQDFLRWEDAEGTTLSTNRIYEFDTDQVKTLIAVYETP